MLALLDANVVDLVVHARLIVPQCLVPSAICLLMLQVIQIAGNSSSPIVMWQEVITNAADLSQMEESCGIDRPYI